MAKQKFQSLILLLIILRIEISTSDVSRVSCTMGDNNKKCTLTRFTITSRNSSFIPVAPDADAVLKVEIIRSIVPILTSNICTTFTKLKSFIAIDQHIEIVEDDAFYNCTDLMFINLELNNIHKLGSGITPSRIFSNTKKLQFLHILGGSLEHVEADLFSNLGDLRQLLFGANGLKNVPVALIKNLKKLEYFYIYSNDLSDLDAKGLVENLPSLKKIFINDNNFHCDSLIEIIDIFKASEIIMPDLAYEKHVKKRDYIPRKIGNIVCLSQAQQEAENLKTALTRSLNELKDLPLGKEIIELKEIVSTGFGDSDSEIVNLSNTLNATSHSLNAQISNLNEKLNDTPVKLQKLEDSIASLLDKYKNLSFNEKLIENGSPPYDSLNHNLIAVWICLVSLLLIIVAIGLYVCKKFRNFYVDVPLCYEDRFDRHNLQTHQESFA